MILNPFLLKHDKNKLFWISWWFWRGVSLCFSRRVNEYRCGFLFSSIFLNDESFMSRFVNTICGNGITADLSPKRKSDPFEIEIKTVYGLISFNLIHTRLKNTDLFSADKSKLNFLLEMEAYKKYIASLPYKNTTKMAFWAQ